jgi:hypothetical protein
MNYAQWYRKVSILPEELKLEVVDFIDSLRKRGEKGKKQKSPKFGCAKGQIYMSPDFDAPLDDFKEHIG